MTFITFHVSTTTASGGYYITLLDLSPLLVSAGKGTALFVTNVVPLIKIEFTPSCSQLEPVEALNFSADGTSLVQVVIQ